MATNTDLEQGVDIWQEIAELLIHIRRTEGDTNRDDLRIWSGVNCKTHGPMPKAFKNKYRGLHGFKYSSQIRKLVMAVEKLRKNNPECFYQPTVGPHHNEVMNDICFILCNMKHPFGIERNVLDADKRSKGYQGHYKEKSMKSWYWNFAQLLAEVWWGIEDPSIRLNPGKITKTKTPNKNHREPTQSPTQQFHKLFDINKPKGEQQ